MFKTLTRTRVLLLASAGLVLAVGIVWVAPRDSYLLRQWQAGLASLPDEDVPVRLEQVAAIGDRGRPVLVELLHSDRKVVAQEAFRLLSRYLDEQELVAPEESSPRVCLLSKELAEQSRSQGEHAGHASVRLATRLLLWPIDRNEVDGEQLVANCEKAIRAFSTDETEDGSGESHDSLVAPTRGLDAPNIMSASALADLPGGGLTVELAELPELARREADFAPPAQREPRSFYPMATRSILDDRSVGAPTTSAPPLAEESQPLESRLETFRPGIVLRRESSRPAEPERGSTELPMSERPVLEVMQLLASADPDLAHRASDELSRRGFRPHHLQLAERLFDPDAEVRRQLVDRLPQLPAIDSRPWLIWLSSDADAEVRKAAIGFIATANDPALLDHLRKLEKTETNDAVLQLIRSALARPH